MIGWQWQWFDNGHVDLLCESRIDLKHLD